MTEEDDELRLDDLGLPPEGLTPPFSFEFSVYCPWATSVQVLVHVGAHGEGGHRLVELEQIAMHHWCGEVDLSGRDHSFSYRVSGSGRTTIAPFFGGYAAPETYAHVKVRATYPGRPKAEHPCS